MNITKEIRPYESGDGEFEPLLSFTQQAALMLDPNLIVSLGLLSETKEEEPYNYTRTLRCFGRTIFIYEII